MQHNRGGERASEPAAKLCANSKHQFKLCYAPFGVGRRLLLLLFRLYAHRARERGVGGSGAQNDSDGLNNYCKKGYSDQRNAVRLIQAAARHGHRVRVQLRPNAARAIRYPRRLSDRIDLTCQTLGTTFLSTDQTAYITICVI